MEHQVECIVCVVQRSRGSATSRALYDSNPQEGTMTVSVVRLYNPVLWEYSRVYRWLLVMGRALELFFTLGRFVGIKVPLRAIRGEREPDLARSDDILLKGTRTIERTDHGTVGYQKKYWDKERLEVFTKGEESKIPRSFGWGIVRILLEELGPTFIKLGQILSMQAFTPPAFRYELEYLQEKVAPVSYKEVRKIIAREFGVPLEEVYAEFSEKPFAAASLAQVHRAKLQRGGVDEVAVKVQRPSLQATVMVDLAIIDVLFVILRIMLPELRRKTDIKVFTSGFGSALRDEIDFVREGRNQDKIREYYASNSDFRDYIKIAHIYWDYVTGKVLTMELHKGMMRMDCEEVLEVFRSTTHIGIPRWDMNRWPLTNLVGSLVMDGMFSQHFIYIDFHLGNLYFSLSEKKIIMLDFGMCEKVETEAVYMVEQLLEALYLYSDGGPMKAAALRLHEYAGGKRKDVNIEELGRRCDAYIHTHYSHGGSSVRECGMSDQAEGAMIALAADGLMLPSFLWYFLKSIAGMLKVGSMVDPRYDGRSAVMSCAGIAFKDRLKSRVADATIVSFSRTVDELTRDVVGSDQFELACWGVTRQKAAEDPDSKFARHMEKGSHGY